MHSPRTVTTLIVSLAVAGALLLTGCGSETTTSAPTVATSAPTVATSAPAKSGVVSWSCFDDGEEVTCTCEGSEADCKSSVTDTNAVKGATGTVQWFSEEKGFGFISPSDGGRAVYVHFSRILGGGYQNLNAGQSVCFDIKEGPKGPEARNVGPC